MHQKQILFGGKQILIRIYIVSGILVTMNNYKLYSICSISMKNSPLWGSYNIQYVRSISVDWDS